MTKIIMLILNNALQPFGTVEENSSVSLVRAGLQKPPHGSTGVSVGILIVIA